MAVKTAVFITNLHPIIISDRSPQCLTQIGVGPAHTITESGEHERWPRARWRIHTHCMEQVCKTRAARSFQLISGFYNIGRARVLATCLMADPRALCGTCSKANPGAARDTLLSYRAGHEWTHLTICAWVLSKYLTFSPLLPEKPRSGRSMLYSSGQVTHHGAGTVTSAIRGCLGGHAGPTRPSAGRQGTVREFV